MGAAGRARAGTATPAATTTDAASLRRTVTRRSSASPRTLLRSASGLVVRLGHRFVHARTALRSRHRLGAAGSGVGREDRAGALARVARWVHESGCSGRVVARRRLL